MNAVIYARYSSDNQREESIEGQIRECKAYAEKNGITILSSYIDRAFSARTANRPEFQRMIKDSAKRLFDVVLVWKLDRFSRDRYDSAHYKSILKKNSVKVTSATETINADSTGVLMESILEGYAEFYSAELSEKVIRGLTENALKCKYNGGGLPVGYTIDSEQYFQIDTLTAPTILDAFKQYDKGKTIRTITDDLNRKGIRTSANKPMSINSVTRILKNRRYIGEYRYRDVVQPGGIPAIVPQNLFDRVQKRLEKNKKAPARHKAEDDYLLTTKLFCGKCGAYMVGESGTSHTLKVHRYYKCVTAKKRRGCTKKSVKKDYIETLVVEHAVKMLLSDSVLDKITDSVMDLQARENISLPLLQKQLAEVEKGIENLLDAIQQGLLNESTKKRFDELETRKSEIEISILQEEMQRPILTREQVRFWLSQFRKLDISKKEHRQRLIDSFINAVYLYDDKLVVTFNYKDGSKTVSLKEISGSDLVAGAAPLKIGLNIVF